MLVKLIPADDNKLIQLVELDTEKHDPIAAAGGLIGGFIALLHTQKLIERQQVMLVDEDGLMKGLPVNSRATRESHYHNLLVGDILVCGEKYDRGGYSTGKLLPFPTR